MDTSIGWRENLLSLRYSALFRKIPKRHPPHSSSPESCIFVPVPNMIYFLHKVPVYFSANANGWRSQYQYPFLSFCELPQITQLKCTTEVHFIQIAAGSINGIIATARDHNDLFFHHLNIGGLFQHRRLPASSENAHIAKAAYRNQKKQPKCQKLFHNNFPFAII